MPDNGDFVPRSRRKIVIAAPGTPGDFRRSPRSTYKIAWCVTGFQVKLEKLWRTKERTKQPTERGKTQDVYVIQIVST